MFDDFYGLTARPFQLTPDPAFYFESGTHRKALSYLGYGLAQGEGFIVITGEVGAGKSTLVAHLMGRIDKEQMTVGQIVTSKLDAEELVHVVAQSFGIEVDGHDKASALGAIEGFLHDEARAGRRTLLVVDESQNLSVDALEELRMFSNFQLGAHPLLQVLLLGQPEFRQTLQAHPDLEQLRQRVIAAHHLEAMEPVEIQPYIVHRLECVGYDGNPSIDQRVFSELHNATGGIPRKVNQVFTRLLLLGAVEQRTRIDNAMLSAVLKEMEADRAFPEAGPGPMPKPSPAPVPVQIKHSESTFSQPEPAQADKRAIDPALVENLLAERDTQIAELQQAVVEVSQAQENGLPDDVTEQLKKIEERLDEQESTIRHTLTMLIEYIECDSQRQAA